MATGGVALVRGNGWCSAGSYLHSQFYFRAHMKNILFYPLLYVFIVHITPGRNYTFDKFVYEMYSS